MHAKRQLTFAFRSVSLSIALLIAACAHPQTTPPVPQTAEAMMEAQKQKEIVFRSERAEIDRLQSIGDRLRMGAAPLCNDIVPRFGWAIVNRFSFDAATRDIATAEYQLGDRLKVVRLTTDGPAERAGVMVGDEIVQAGDAGLSGTGAESSFDKIAKDSFSQRNPMMLELLRHGESLVVDLTGMPSCNYTVALTGGEKLNGSTDGRRIFVSSGLVRFARDDTELALVIAHEMSHDIRNHVEAKRKNASTGSAIGVLLDVLAAAGGSYGNTFSSLGAQIGAGAYSQEFEREADYVSLYVMALSGYDIAHAPDFWRRMATVRPDEIDKGYTHPSTAQRFVALEAAVREIHGKQAIGAEMRPEIRKN